MLKSLMPSPPAAVKSAPPSSPPRIPTTMVPRQPGRSWPVTSFASTPARNPTTIHDSQLMAPNLRRIAGPDRLRPFGRHVGRRLGTFLASGRACVSLVMERRLTTARLMRLGGVDGRAVRAGIGPLGRRLRRRARAALQAARRGRHLLELDPEQEAGLATGPRPTRATSPGSRTAPSSAPTRGGTPDPPTTGWTRPRCDAKLDGLFQGSMRGRTMYVIPFSMGPLGSPLSYIGVELTDSPYVAVSMRAMTRAGTAALEVLGDDGDVRAVHPLARRAARAGRGRLRVAVQPRREVDRPLPRDPRDLVVRVGLRRQRPARQEVLRAAHRVGDRTRRGLARRAHADPQAHVARRGAPSTSAAAFPSACGKTNLAMLIPTIPGWKAECVGDDIAG